MCVRRQNRFDVASSSLVLDEQRFSVAGSATFRDDAVVLDMDVATGDLSWAQVEKVLGRLEDAKTKAAAAVTAVETKAVETSPKTAAPASLAIGGDVRVSLGSFSYGDFVWKPVLADVRFEKDAVTAAVRMAEVCGISTTGEARVLPGGAVALEARVDAAGPDINVPLTCLGLENVGMTGSYEASVAGQGRGGGLRASARGPGPADVQGREGPDREGHPADADPRGRQRDGRLRRKVRDPRGRGDALRRRSPSTESWRKARSRFGRRR